MIWYKLIFVLYFCLFWRTNFASGPSVQDAVEEHLKDIKHNEGEQSLKHNNKKGEQIHNIENDVKNIHKDQYSKAVDEAKYTTKDHDKKSSSDSDSYGGHNYKKDKAEDSAAAGFKRDHKKGHHKQGFQNSYHKDESSNKSEYFDDVNDQGDQAGYNSKLNSYDNHGGRSYHGSHDNGQEYLRDNYRGGGFNKLGENGLKHRGNHDYGKKYYLDDSEHYNKYKNDRDIYERNKVHDHRQYHAPHQHREPGWNWDQWEDRRRWERPDWNRRNDWNRGNDWNRDRGWNDRGWERDYVGPGYYDDRGIPHNGGYGNGYGYGESRQDPVSAVPRNVPMVAQHKQQTITIYEDPRYDGKDKGHLRRNEGDYFHLDFKPSSQRYASNENPQRRAVESSNINKLVYNYRRQ